MKPASAKYLDLLERRLGFLRALIRWENEWRTAFIGLKLKDSERCVSEEEVLCEQIRALDKEIAALEEKQFAPPMSAPEERATSSAKPLPIDPVIYPRILVALQQMTTLHLQLKHSNETRRAILKRSKFTLNALRNLFNSHAPTYAAPVALRTGSIYEENV